MGRSGAVSSTPTSLPDDAAHVLVVDDDRRLRALLSSYLVKHGHRVTVAPTAAKARDFLDGLAFDIIVLDVMMPGENGFDFASDLRTRSQVPILMLTARGESQDRVRGLEIGVDDYLAKPFEPRERCCGSAQCCGEPEPRRPAASRPASFASDASRFRSSAESCELERIRFASRSANARCCAYSAQIPERSFLARRCRDRAAPLRSERSMSSSIGCGARSSKTPLIRYTCRRREERGIG